MIDLKTVTTTNNNNKIKSKPILSKQVLVVSTFFFCSFLKHVVLLFMPLLHSMSDTKRVNTDSAK